MILALIILWVLTCVVFFGSLALIASVPTPPMDIATARELPPEQPQHAELMGSVVTASGHAA